MSAYQVLARKWRPKNFAGLVGQQHVVKALQNALAQGRLHHAYLLTGTRGVGKTTIARILAKSLNCTDAQAGEPCGQCQSCRDIDAGRFVDLLEIDAASNTGIDNIREVLENAQYAPTAGKYKVYIIDEVHMLSKSAFNAMLKTLEEPPEHVKFILATTDPHKVPVTVLSRCLQFVLRNMSPQQVADHLAHVADKEGIAYEAAALGLLGRAAAGSMRDALSLLDQAVALGQGSVREADVRQMIGAADKRYLFELLEYLMQQNGEAMMAKAAEMAANAVGFDGALADLAALMQRLALFKAVPAAIPADDPEHERLLHLSHYFGDEQIQLYYQCLIHGRQDLPLAPDEYAGFVMTLLRMLAFAPFAAKNVPAHAVIEGTQLHSPEAAAAKHPLPETPVSIPVSGSLNPSGQADETGAAAQNQVAPQTAEAEDTPPWPPENGAENRFVAKTNEFARAETVSGSLNGADAADEAEPTEAEQNPIAPPTAETGDTPPWLPERAEMDDGPAETDALAGADGFSGSLNAVDAVAETYPNDPVPNLFAAASEASGAVQAETAATADDATPENTAMPEFTAANWPYIAARIGKKVSAAQMPLAHMAWADFADGVLHLALVEEQTRNNLKKEYLDRIAAALSEAYAMPVRIQTRPFEAGQGWETPAMYRERRIREDREQAKKQMEQDPAMRQIQDLFQTRWHEESLTLLDGTEE